MGRGPFEGRNSARASDPWRPPPLSDTDYAAVEPLARAFDWFSADAAMAETPVPRPGRVLAYDDRAAEAAWLLAALTGRQPLRNTSGASIPGGVELVVGLAGAIDDRLVEQVLRRDAPAAIGLIVGRDPAELRERAIAAAVAARARPASLPTRIVLQPDWDLAEIGAGSVQILGSHAPARNVRKALSSGDTLVTLAGHGDGIDGELPGGLVLCPQDAAFQALEHVRRPLCRATGHCYRLKRAIADPAFESSVVHPASIVTRALVWNSCVGWPSADGFIARGYGVGLRLATSPRIGALITTDRVVMAPRDLTEPLVAAVLRGVPLGEAVARHNASQEARRYSHRLLLFGDPASRIAPPLPAGASPSTPRRAHAMPPAPAQTLSAGDRQLGALLRVLLTGSPRQDSDAAWATLQERMTSGSLEGFWARTAHRVSPASAPSSCPYCGLATTDHALTTNHPMPLRRIVRVCARCEVISDRDTDETLDIRIDRDKARLLGPLPPGPWRAALILRQRWPLETTRHPWPVETSGGLRASLPLPLRSSSLPTMASVVAHGPGRLAIFSRALPAGQINGGAHP